MGGAVLDGHQRSRQAHQPIYKFKLTREKDTVLLQEQNEHTTFVIGSASGIGGVTISLIKGQWPTNVAFRLQYANGKGFEHLEGMHLETARSQAEGGEDASENVPFYLKGADGQYDTKQPPTGHLNITMKVKEGAMEVDLPANLLVGSRELRLNWIDFYR